MTSPTKSRAAAWWPPFLWALLIFIGSSLPGGEADEATRQASGMKDPIHIQRIKDAVHVTEFGILMLLLVRALRFRGHKNPIWIGLAATVLYGISDEAHQYFVPQRYLAVEDIIRNTAGAILGASIMCVRRKRSSNNKG